jgi:hypothetical protein
VPEVNLSKIYEEACLVCIWIRMLNIKEGANEKDEDSKIRFRRAAAGYRMKDNKFAEDMRN